MTDAKERAAARQRRHSCLQRGRVHPRVHRERPRADLRELGVRRRRQLLDRRNAEIAREYEARDPRIRVLTPATFVDQIESGNRSLREISPQSKYTKVLHADDWLFLECLERMVALAERNPTVGVVSAYRLEETRVTLTGLPHAISVLSGREICRAHLLGDWPYTYLFGSPSSILVRSDLVRAL